jgi:hypothetical protein
MKTKFIELYTDLYDRINFDVSIDDIKDIAHKNNFNLAHYKIKDGHVKYVDDEEYYNNQYNSSQFMLLLKLVAEKYQDLDIELVFCLYDFPPDVFKNLPVFALANNSKNGVYNPVVFYEHAHLINMFNERHESQSKFINKKTRVFGRYGITGFQGISINNWTEYFKVKFALASIMCPHLIDIKFLLVPHDLKYWENLINDTFPTDVKQIMFSMPVYDTTIKNFWIDVLDHAFDSKVCIFNEGNSIASPGRILTCLHNDGVAIKIGKDDHKSFLELIIDSIDDQIIYSIHDTPDNHFYSTVDESLSDDTYRLNKNKLVKQYFNQETMIDLTYETLKLYSVLVKK